MSAPQGTTKPTNMQMTAQMMVDAETWNQEQVAVLRRALRTSSLILFPYSRTMQCWGMMMLPALLWAIFVTPYELAFVSETALIVPDLPLCGRSSA